MEYIYNSFNLQFLSADSNIHVIDFLLVKDAIVLLFACLVVFYWMPDILSFLLLSVTFCCFHLTIVGLCLGIFRICFDHLEACF